MSKMKGQTFRYRFGTKPKRFGIVPEFALLFQFGSESAVQGQIEIIPFCKTNSGTNSNVSVSFRFDIGTFV
jgi:hypothetical protein